MQTNLSNENIIHIQDDKVQYIQFKKLLEYKEIINHAYTIGIDVNFRTAINGKADVSSTQYKIAKKSYKSICKAIGSKYRNLVKPRQYHTNNVKIVKNKINVLAPDFNLKKYKETDGLITNRKKVVLSTTNADCILFLIFDPEKR